MQTSGPQYYRKAYQDFTGGLSSRPNPLQIGMNKFAVLQNAILNDSDILQKSEGYVLDGSPFPNVSDSFIRMLVNYKVGTSVNTLVCAAQDNGNTNAVYKVDLKQSYGDGTYKYIGHTVGTALFTLNSATVTGTGTTWTNHLKAGDKIGTGAQPGVWYEIQTVGSDTSITLTSPYLETTTTSTAYMARIILNKNNLPVGLVFNNNLIISNGSEGPMETNNTTLNKFQSANWKAVNLLELHKNRVFGANWSASPSGLIWTSVNDETVVDGTSNATIFAQDNGQIVAIKSFANSLLIFKDNGKVYQVTGEFDQSAAGQPNMIRALDMPDNLGVISGKTVCVLEDNSGEQGYQRLGSKVYFLSETGIYTINSWLQVQKVSWDIQPSLANILLKSTATTTKQYSFTDKAQWDTGTINSLSDTRNLNGLSTFFDSLNITGARQDICKTSIAIDSSNNVHCAWVTQDNTTIKYTKWLATDNSTTTSTVTNLAVAVSGPGQRFDCVSIAVAPNGNVGIASKLWVYFVAGVPSVGWTQYEYHFSELVAGAWTTQTTTVGVVNPFATPANYQNYHPEATGISCAYTASSSPLVLTGQDRVGGSTGFNGFGSVICSRVGTTWSTNQVSGEQRMFSNASLYLDGSGNYYAALAEYNSPRIYYYYSTDGTTWSAPLSSSTLAVPYLTCAGTNPSMSDGYVSVSCDEKSNAIITYCMTGGTGGDVGKIVQVNTGPNTPITTYDESAASVLKGAFYDPSGAKYVYSLEGGLEKIYYDVLYSGGTAAFTGGNATVTGTSTKWTTWVKAGDTIKLGTDSVVDYGVVLSVNSDNSITLTAPYAGSTGSGAYLAKRRLSVTATGSPVCATTPGAADRALVSNGAVIAVASFGLNSGEIRLRRITTQGQWTSPINSDSGMSSWSTFVVTNPVTNGNLITYECGVNTTSSITDNLINIIVPGSVISTAAASIDIKARITFTLQVFASASIDTLVLNYIGLGIDAKMPFGYVFNNEMYLSVTAPSGSGNNEIIFLDRKGAWGLFSQGSCAMTRYNQQLYVGDTVGGNIFKFRQGYNFNGSAYSLIAETKEDLLGSMELQKEIYKVYVIYETQSSGTFKFSYRFDNFLNSAGSAWVDTTVDQTSGTVYEVTGIAGQPLSSIQFKIQQDDANVQVGVVGFMVLYKYLNLR